MFTQIRESSYGTFDLINLGAAEHNNVRYLSGYVFLHFVVYASMIFDRSPFHASKEFHLQHVGLLAYYYYTWVRMRNHFIYCASALTGEDYPNPSWKALTEENM